VNKYILPILLLLAQLSTAQEAPVVDFSDMTRAKVLDILSLDVFSYNFEQTSKFDTDLKKSVFKKSDDYKTLLKQLTETRKALLTNTITVLLSEKHFVLSDYSLKSKTFLLDLGTNFGFGEMHSDYQYSVLGFVDENMPIFERQDSWDVGGGKTYYSVRVKTDEETAMKMEDSKGSLMIRMTCRVVGSTSRSYKEYDIASGNWFNSSDKYVVVKAPQLEFLDSQGNVLFQTNYK